MSRLKKHPGRFSGKQGLNLIELMVFVGILAVIITGVGKGADLASGHGPWMKACGAILGGIGGVAAIALLFFLFWLYGAVKRALEPADLVCRCHESGTAVPDHLLPHTPVELEAIAESRRFAEWPEYGRIQSSEAATVNRLRSRLVDGLLSEERVALAAGLGDPAAAALRFASREPLLKYRHWAHVPEDVQKTLKSGLPPRLCMIWALACAERTLPVFEQEFVHDTRPRQVFGAAFLFLKDGKADALDLVRSFSRKFWLPREAGCRVLHRDLKERIRGHPSRGERAADSLFRMARAVSDFVEPKSLWCVCTSDGLGNAYFTPRNRCDWSQPSFCAEDVAYMAAQAAIGMQSEFQWQREELVRMILGWERWTEDREAWRIRVDEEWIPRVQAIPKGLPFNVPAYIERIRKELVPWRRQTNS